MTITWVFYNHRLKRSNSQIIFLKESEKEPEIESRVISKRLSVERERNHEWNAGNCGLLNHFMSIAQYSMALLCGSLFNFLLFCDFFLERHCEGRASLNVKTKAQKH